MNMNPVNWFEIYIQNVDRAKAFYETVLQLQLTALDGPMEKMEMWAFPMEEGVPGAAGALVRMEGVPSGGNSTLVYFSCDDCALAAARVNDAGGKLIQDKFSIGEYGFIAIAEDTEGNTIGLHSEQ